MSNPNPAPDPEPAPDSRVVLLETVIESLESTIAELRGMLREAHHENRRLANKPDDCTCVVCLPVRAPEDSELLADIIAFDPRDDATDLLSRSFARLEELTSHGDGGK